MMLKRVLNFTKRSKTKFVAVVSAIAVAVSGFSVSVPMLTAADTVSASAATEKTYEGITDGAILHAFCWSFDTIKANMENIAKAGYTAIQTSPINAVNETHPAMKLMGNNGDGSDGAWWWHYQPTDWKIGNYQLGTRDQFQEMCAEADKYGIKIIVDVVPNHTTPDLSQVSQDLIDAAGGKLYHDTAFEPISDWGNRFDCTRKQMGGLPDVDTENAGFQNYFIAYLNDCIACGADGFRYDTAKHIALPDDDTAAGVENNFWPRVTTEITNASEIFNYGEVLQGSNDRADAYVDMLGSTCTSNYGAAIRSSVTSMDLNVGRILSYQIDTTETKNLVTWVESHDNYINDGTWSQLDDTQVKLAWAIITAREEGVPLFFDRPNGGGPSNKWGTNTIGVAGSDLYQDDEVVAVNWFRSAMAEGDNPEYLRNPNGDTNVLMIERGTAGVVIVNAKYDAYSINSETNLADGYYYSETDGSPFIVSNGVITGTVPARGISVLYNSVYIHPTEEETTETEELIETADKIHLFFEKPDSWGSAIYAYVYQESGYPIGEVAAWPGVQMTQLDESNEYEVTIDCLWSDGYVIFTDGTNQVPGAMQTGFDIAACGLYDVNGYVGHYFELKRETETETETEIETELETEIESEIETEPETEEEAPTGAMSMYFKKPDSWGTTINAYVYKETDTKTYEEEPWPGIEMERVEGYSNIYQITVNSSYPDGGYIIFNDGTNQIPAAMEPGFPVIVDGFYSIDGYLGALEEEKEEEELIEPSQVTGVQAVYENGAVKLTWDDNGAAQYRVMRFDGITEGYTTLTYRATANGYTDSDMIDAHRYFYRVCGYFYDADGNLVQGTVSAAAGVVATDREPSKVENVEASVSDGEVTLTWNAADGVRYYKIARAYGATAAEGSYTSLQYNVEETNYTDTTIQYNGTYRYKVVGYYKSVPGDWVYGTMSDTLFVTVQ